MTRRPLSSPAPVYAGPPVTQSRWSASVVPGRCSACALGLESGERFLAVRSWSEGQVRARVESYCTRCVESARTSSSVTAETA